MRSLLRKILLIDLSCGFQTQFCGSFESNTMSFCLFYGHNRFPIEFIDEGSY